MKNTYYTHFYKDKKELRRVCAHPRIFPPEPNFVTFQTDDDMEVMTIDMRTESRITFVMIGGQCRYHKHEILKMIE